MPPDDPRPSPRLRSRAARAAVCGAVAAGLLGALAGCGDDVTAGPGTSAPAAATTPGTTATSGATGASGTRAGETTSGGTDGTAGPSAPTGAATGGSPAAAPVGASPEPSGAPGSEGSAAAGSTTPQASAAPGGGSALLRDAGTGTSEAGATGSGLSVVAVRTGRHDGFDRVVLELAGESGSEPGWYARYVDEPAQEGSGAPLQVAGSSSLAVVVRGLGYPFDTGQDEVVGSTTSEGTALVREVLVGAVHEGQAQVVVGLEAQAPYRITRLSDPPRVVVDVVT